MNNFLKTLERVKQILDVENDSDVAEFIGMKPSAFANRKKSGSIPFSHYLKLIESHNVNLNWLVYGEGPIYKTEISSSEKTTKSDPDRSSSNITTVVIEHQDIVKRFKNPEKAKEFNEFLVEIEGEDPEGYDELFKEAKAIYKTIKRIKNKQDSKKTPNNGEDIQDKSTA